MTARRRAAVVLVGVAAFAGMLAWYLTADVDSLGSLVKRMFGGASLCVAVPLVASCVTWIVVATPESRRASAAGVGSALGLGLGLFATGVLIYTPWTGANANDKVVAALFTPGLATIAGFVVGMLIARRASRP